MAARQRVATALPLRGASLKSSFSVTTFLQLRADEISRWLHLEFPVRTKKFPFSISQGISHLTSGESAVFHRQLVDHPLNLRNSRFFSLINGNLIAETGSIRLHPPPRIHAFCRHVETCRKCPLTVGFPNASFESPSLRKGRRPISDLSLCRKKSRSWRRKGVVARASPRSCRCWMRTASEICKCEEVESGLGQTKPLKLQRPFGRRITQGGDADAARKPPFDCGLDQSWRDEGHRYRHVTVTAP